MDQQHNAGRSKKFFLGAAILAVSGLICKVIGAFYRIPLQNNILGLDGMSLYQLSYPVYSMLVVVSTSGLATAISKMVAERVVHGDYQGAKRIFVISRNLLLGIGLSTMAIMLVGNRWITAIQGDPLANLVNLAIAPALFFVALLSAYRGYFQGMQEMTPTAVSQLLEQVFKLIFGFSLATLGVRYGASFAADAHNRSIQYGAAGAMLGVTVSEVIALGYMILVYGRRRKKLRALEQAQTAPREERKTSGIIGRMLQLAIPVTLGAAVMPMVFYIDSAMVVNILTGAGTPLAEARSLYGLLSGPVNTLMNLPGVLTSALAMSLVPAISAAWARKDHDDLNEKTGAGIRIALMLGLPCSAGLFILAKQILTLLYASSVSDYMTQAVQLLQVISVAVAFLSVVQSMTGVLQGTGKVLLPVRNLAIGAVCKVIVGWLLLRIPGVNILGAAVGTLVCFIVAGVLDMVSVLRITKARISIVDTLLRPLAAAVGMAAAVWLMVFLLEGVIRNSILTALAIAVGACVYFALLILTRALSREDAQLVLGKRGRRLVKLLPTRRRK